MSFWAFKCSFLDLNLCFWPYTYSFSLKNIHFYVVLCFKTEKTNKTQPVLIVLNVHIKNIVLKSDFNNCKIIHSIQILIKSLITIMERRALLCTAATFETTKFKPLLTGGRYSEVTLSCNEGKRDRKIVATVGR